MKQRQVAKATLSRLPRYLQFLRDSRGTLPTFVSATVIAKGLGLGEVQVRKDLAAASGIGKPKVGYNTADLTECLEHFLGYDKKMPALVVGAGHMGKALLAYTGFESYGMEIIAAFDEDKATIGEEVNGKKIYAMSELSKVRAETDAKIGIITVPVEEAQAVCDKLIEAGVTAIWNFAPINLNVPEGVTYTRENLALSLAYLNLQAGK